MSDMRNCRVVSAMGWGPGLSGAYWTLRITRRTEFLEEDSERRTQAAHRLHSFLAHSGSNPSFLLVCWVRRMPWKVLSGCPPGLQVGSPVAGPGCPRQLLGSLHSGGYLHPSPKMFSDPSLPWRTPPSQPHPGRQLYPILENISSKLGSKLRCPFPAASPQEDADSIQAGWILSAYLLWIFSSRFSAQKALTS